MEGARREVFEKVGRKSDVWTKEVNAANKCWEVTLLVPAVSE